MIGKTLCFTVTFLFCTTTQVWSSTVKAGVSSDKYSDLATTQWLHGAKSCKNDQNPPLQVIQADASSFVIRQNKCTTFEAPFIYVLFGSEKALVVDTGAIESPSESPVFKTIESLMLEQQFKLSDKGANGSGKLIVVHSHSHSDHTEGDSQFKGKEGVELVGTSSRSVEKYLALKDWPNMTSSIDLGGRVITFIPIPGHQEQSIAIYDDQTQWLLTGDTLYPGSIRVKNWEAFKSSIERLLLFSQSHPVSLILGAHIEMNSETKKLYRIGKTYQPKEPPLALLPSQLKTLNDKLRTTKKSKELKFDSFVISPLSAFEKLINKVMTKKRHDD
jgi:glyoxylase-like metal-dependent hydrolase (beta-lactamase superfamily II)